MIFGQILNSNCIDLKHNTMKTIKKDYNNNNNISLNFQGIASESLQAFNISRDFNYYLYYS